MPGPKDISTALKWIQEAMEAGRYHPAVHFYDRLFEWHLDFEDVIHAIADPFACETYDRGIPEHEGTCWRITGPSMTGGRDVSVGVEAYHDKKKHRCILCTVFDPHAEKEGDR